MLNATPMVAKIMIGLENKLLKVEAWV